jgi:hypothetical protein
MAYTFQRHSVVTKARLTISMRRDFPFCSQTQSISILICNEHSVQQPDTCSVSKQISVNYWRDLNSCNHTNAESHFYGVYRIDVSVYSFVSSKCEYEN